MLLGYRRPADPVRWNCIVRPAVRIQIGVLKVLKHAPVKRIASAARDVIHHHGRLSIALAQIELGGLHRHFRDIFEARLRVWNTRIPFEFHAVCSANDAVKIWPLRHRGKTIPGRTSPSDPLRSRDESLESPNI